MLFVTELILGSQLTQMLDKRNHYHRHINYETDKHDGIDNDDGDDNN